MTQEQTAQARKPRMTELLSFLKKEMVGNELLFTAEHARRVTEEMGFSHPTRVWNTLRNLEQSGQIVRKKKKHGQGILVSLNAGEPQTRKGRKGSTPLSVPQLLNQLETEIASLENAIAAKEKQLAEKKTLYKQISMLARR